MDVTLPNGATLKNLPEGITREELIDKLQRNGYDPVKLGLMTREQERYAQAGQKLREAGGLPTGKALTRASGEQYFASLPGPQRALAGGLGRFDEAAYAIKKLFSQLTPQEQNRVLTGGAAQQTGLGRAGGVTADIAMKAPAFLAGGAGLQAAGMTGAFPQAGAAGLIGAGTGALLEPENRGLQALAQGLGATTGSLIGSGLTGPMAPASGSAAQALQAQGVPLTPGQAAGGFWKRAEDASKVILDPSVSKAQARASERWNLVLLNDAVRSTGQTIKKAGHAGIQQAREAFGKAYDKVDALPVARDPAASTAISDIVRKSLPDVVDHKALQRVSNSVQGLVAREELTHGALRTKARDLVTLAGRVDDPALARAYRAMAGALDDVRTKSGAGSPDLDLGYAKFLRIEEAASKGAEGIFSVGQLRQAVKSAAEARQLASGKALLQAEVEQAAPVLGETIPPMGPGTAERLLVGGSAMGIPTAALTYLASGNPGAAAASTLVPMGMIGAGKLAYTTPMTKMLTGAYPWQAGIEPAWAAALAAQGGRGLVR